MERAAEPALPAAPFRHASAALLLAWAALSGCSEPYRWKTCKTAECRAATIEKQYEKDSASVLGALAALEDPIEQAALVEQLAHAYPQTRDQLCSIVDAGTPAAERCNVMLLRPHLYQAAVSANAGSTQARRAPGPSSVLLPAPGIEPNWRSESEDEARGECGRVPACLAELAKSHAQEGRVALGGKACELAWPEGSAARDECLFTVAEQVAAYQGFEHIETAAAMCDQASRFRSNCIQHVLIEAAPAGVWADNPDPALIREMIAATDKLKSLWDGETGQFYSDFLWAYWTRESFDGVDTLTGHLVQAVPDEAIRHVHAAAAWRVVQVNSVTAGLERTAAFVKDSLYAPVTGPGPTREPRTHEPGERIRGIQPDSYWLGDRDEEASLPATYFIGAGRRTYVEDPLDDIRICLLEAAVRLSPKPDPSFFYQVVPLSYSEPVRWTGARLGATAFQKYPRPDLTQDPSSLVRIYSRGTMQP